MSSEPARPGLLFVVSAPSGTGKTTIVERLVQVVPGLSLSRSYTSRQMRGGERDGVDYNFITRPRFEGMVKDGAFLEWADVFGNLYGTCAADTDCCAISGECSGGRPELCGVRGALSAQLRWGASIERPCSGQIGPPVTRVVSAKGT